MKVLILGANGYLGYNLSHYFYSKKEKVYAAVRNIEQVEKYKTIHTEIIPSDLYSIEKLLKIVKIDWIINTVCLYRTATFNLPDMYESNVLYPTQVLGLAIKYDCPNFMTMGTSLPEYTDFYSFTKNKFSEIGKYHSSLGEINFADIKLEMFYGGMYEPMNRFIPSIINKLNNNQSIDLTSGTQKRDIVHIEDVVYILHKICSGNSCKSYKEYSVGCGESESIKNIVKYLYKKTQSSSVLNFGALPLRKDEPNTCADISWYDNYNIVTKFSFWDGLDEECFQLCKHEVI